MIANIGEYFCVARTENVLIAAPDAGFRHSLAFALKSDGYAVYAYVDAAEAFLSPHAREAACAVIDDDAVGDWDQVPEQFSRFAKPVVLLMGQFRTVPELSSITPLMKPYLGAPLIEAVRSAIAGLE